MREKKSSVRKVAVLGATGMVGRRLASMLVDHPMFELEMVIGSDATSGLSYRSVWEEKERILRDHYGSFWREYPCPKLLWNMQVSPFTELLRSDCSIVFSSIPDRTGYLEETLLQDEIGRAHV